MFEFLRSRIGRSRQGALAPVGGIVLVGVMASAAVAVDVGFLYTAKLEAKRVADFAAIAAMDVLIQNPGNPQAARDAAIDLASHNTIRGLPVTLDASDIQVMTGTDTAVVINIMRTQERGNALDLMFARILGFEDVDMVAISRAENAASGGAACLKPFLVPDLWDDADGDGIYDAGEYYDPEVTGYGSSFRFDLNRDVGRSVTLYPAGSPGTVNPSWYNLFRLDGNQGGNDIRDAIANSSCTVSAIRLGESYDAEPGAKTGPVQQGMDDLIGQDPGAYWNPSTLSVEGSMYGSNWTRSPRMVKIAAYDPTQVIDPGARPILVSNVLTIFLEDTPGQGFTGRVVPTLGAPIACDGFCAGNIKYSQISR